jgi:arylsulfatase A-like enzyme
MFMQDIASSLYLKCVYFIMRYPLIGIRLFLLLVLSQTAYTQTPNIVYILADDLGIGDVRVFNPASRIATPAIDGLAAEGMRFTDAHSGSAVCTPTRYGILTGRYAWRTRLQNGVLWSYDPPLIDANRQTIADVLKTKGYQTACIGKWHLGLGWAYDAKGQPDLTKPLTEGPLQLGFDRFFGMSASLDIPPYIYINGERTTASRIDTIAEQTGKGFWRAGPIGNDFRHADVLDTFIQRSIQFIEEAVQKPQPFFLYLALTSPHTPILPVDSFQNSTGTNAYGDFVRMTDQRVGQLLQALKATGADKNTLIVFTSDNGCSPSAGLAELKQKGHDPSAGYRGAKADAYEGGHRVPFIVRWPGNVKAGAISNATICLTDFMATCADILDIPLTDSTAEDSFSMLPLLKGKNPKQYKRASTVHHSIDGKFALREGEWKLILSRGSGGWSAPTEKKAEKDGLPDRQLFNLRNDKSEQINLASKYPELVTDLERKMEKIRQNGRSRW